MLYIFDYLLNKKSLAQTGLFFSMFFMFAFTPKSIMANDCWQWQNPLPQSNTIYDICFVDSHTGWAVGAGGMIMKTTDAGSNWHVLDIIEPIDYFSICFIDAQKGWICGDSGIVLRTNDGGASWNRAFVGELFRLNAIRFFDKNIGFAGGQFGSLFKTEDGGIAWEMINLNSSNCTAIFIMDSANGIVIAGSEILTTTDKGSSWDTHTGKPFQSVSFVDNLNGWGAGIGGYLAKTNDGGRTWENISRAEPTPTLFKIHFTSLGNGYAFGYSGIILKTTDGGITWTDMTTESIKFDIYASHFFSDDVGAISGNGGFVASTASGGNDWHYKTTAVTTSHLRAMFFHNELFGYAAGEGNSILYTSNGGKTWTRKTLGFNITVNSIFFTDYQNGWVGGNDIVAQTSDGGDSWHVINITGLGEVTSIHFTDKSNGFINSDSGAVYRTADGGKNWRKFENAPTDLRSVSFHNSEIGWGFAYSEQTLPSLHKTTDGGASWDLQDIRSSISVQMCVIDEFTAYSLQNSGNIIKTTNGGKNWEIIYTNVKSPIRIQFVNKNTGFLISNNRMFYKTTDGGASWQGLPLPYQYGLTNLFFINDKTGWGVGNYGLIMKYSCSSSGVNDSKNHSNNAIKIYPNPAGSFITVELNGGNPVSKFKIFDIIGKEYIIKISAQEDKTISLDISNLPPGIYFLSINSGGRQEFGTFIKKL